MKFLDMCVIMVIIIACVFGLIYISGVSSNESNDGSSVGNKSPGSSVVPAPGSITDTFGNTVSSNVTNASYDAVHGVTTAESQGGSAFLILCAACAVLILIMATIVLTRGQYSKGKYRT